MIKTLTAEIAVIEPTIICNDRASRCDDCPVINPNPPTKSDCPNFEMFGPEPICTKEDDPTQRMIDRGGGSTGIGNMVLPKLAEIIETGQSLPGILPPTS